MQKNIFPIYQGLYSKILSKQYLLTILFVFLFSFHDVTLRSLIDLSNRFLQMSHAALL